MFRCSRISLLLLCLLLSSSVNGEILAHTVFHSIEGVPLGLPRLPLSSRTVYKSYVSTQTAAEIPLVPPSALFPDELHDALIVEGNGLQLMTPLDVHLVPYENIRPGVTAPAVGCTVNVNPANPVVALNVHPADPVASTKRLYQIPIAGVLDRPTLHVERGWWICVRERTGAPADAWRFTELMLQVYIPCDADATAQSATHTPGIAPGVGPNPTFPTSCVEQAAVAPSALLGESGVTDPRYLERVQRLTCCGWRDALTTNGQTLVKRFGMCINNNYQRCCSSRTDNRQSTAVPINSGIGQLGGGIGAPYNFHREQCCHGGDFPASAGSQLGNIRTSPLPVAIRFLDQGCPCILNREGEFCPRFAAGQGAPLCCTQTLFPELVPTGLIANLNNGTCYDPLVQKCCATGAVYDPGVAQCCAVTGLQSPDVPCPCNSDSQCGLNQQCCVRSFPPVDLTTLGSCNAYANYPVVLDPVLRVDPASQNCAGVCIDSRYQICCNGVACVGRYEQCCNDTCCNRFTSDCNMGHREASISPWNPNNFRIPFEVCTEKEALNLPRAIIAYYFPLVLLIATYLGLAFSLFFAKRQNALSPLSGYEKGMYVLALLLILFSWPMYFAPVWRYGVVTIWIAFFTIVAALSGIRVLVLIAAIAQFIGFVYLIDFWYASDLFTLASVRPGSNNGVGHSGNIHSVIKMWRTPFADVPYGQQCTSWYDFFLRDNLTEDWERFDNPDKIAFGFCAREWVATLMVLCLFNIVLLAVLFFVTVITHLKNILVKKVILASGEPVLAGLQ